MKLPVAPTVKYKFPNGKEIDLYYISTLANALGRTPACIRKWEISNVLPDPIFRDKKGNRLYSQEQIDAIVSCAERAKIKQGLSIANTSFAIWVHKDLKQIKEQYLKYGRDK